MLEEKYVPGQPSRGSTTLQIPDVRMLLSAFNEANPMSPVLSMIPYEVKGFGSQVNSGWVDWNQVDVVCRGLTPTCLGRSFEAKLNADEVARISTERALSMRDAVASSQEERFWLHIYLTPEYVETMPHSVEPQLSEALTRAGYRVSMLFEDGDLALWKARVAPRLLKAGIELLEVNGSTANSSKPNLQEAPPLQPGHRLLSCTTMMQVHAAGVDSAGYQPARDEANADYCPKYMRPEPAFARKVSASPMVHTSRCCEIGRSKGAQNPAVALTTLTAQGYQPRAKGRARKASVTGSIRSRRLCGGLRDTSVSQVTSLGYDVPSSCEDVSEPEGHSQMDMHAAAAQDTHGLCHVELQGSQSTDMGEALPENAVDPAVDSDAQLPIPQVVDGAAADLKSTVTEHVIKTADLPKATIAETVCESSNSKTQQRTTERTPKEGIAMSTSQEGVGPHLRPSPSQNPPQPRKNVLTSERVPSSPISTSVKNACGIESIALASRGSNAVRKKQRNDRRQADGLVDIAHKDQDRRMASGTPKACGAQPPTASHPSANSTETQRLPPPQPQSKPSNDVLVPAPTARVNDAMPRRATRGAKCLHSSHVSSEASESRGYGDAAAERASNAKVNGAPHRRARATPQRGGSSLAGRRTTRAMVARVESESKHSTNERASQSCVAKAKVSRKRSESKSEARGPKRSRGSVGPIMVAAKPLPKPLVKEAPPGKPDKSAPIEALGHEAAPPEAKPDVFAFDDIVEGATHHGLSSPAPLVLVKKLGSNTATLAASKDAAHEDKVVIGEAKIADVASEAARVELEQDLPARHRFKHEEKKAARSLPSLAEPAARQAVKTKRNSQSVVDTATHGSRVACASASRGSQPEEAERMPVRTSAPRSKAVAASTLLAELPVATTNSKLEEALAPGNPSAKSSDSCHGQTLQTGTPEIPDATLGTMKWSATGDKGGSGAGRAPAPPRKAKQKQLERLRASMQAVDEFELELVPAAKDDDMPRVPRRPLPLVLKAEVQHHAKRAGAESAGLDSIDYNRSHPLARLGPDSTATSCLVKKQPAKADTVTTDLGWRSDDVPTRIQCVQHHVPATLTHHVAKPNAGQSVGAYNEGANNPATPVSTCDVRCASLQELFSGSLDGVRDAVPSEMEGDDVAAAPGAMLDSKMLSTDPANVSPFEDDEPPLPKRLRFEEIPLSKPCSEDVAAPRLYQPSRAPFEQPLPAHAVSPASHGAGLLCHQEAYSTRMADSRMSRASSEDSSSFAKGPSSPEPGRARQPAMPTIGSIMEPKLKPSRKLRAHAVPDVNPNPTPLSSAVCAQLRPLSTVPRAPKLAGLELWDSLDQHCLHSLIQHALSHCRQLSLTTSRDVLCETLRQINAQAAESQSALDKDTMQNSYVDNKSMGGDILPIEEHTANYGDLRMLANKLNRSAEELLVRHAAKIDEALALIARLRISHDTARQQGMEACKVALDVIERAHTRQQSKMARAKKQVSRYCGDQSGLLALMQAALRPTQNDDGGDDE